MQGIINLFKSPSDNSVCEFTSSLSYLSKRINKFVTDFKSWTCHEEQKMRHYKSESREINEEVKQFASITEELVSSVLLVIQNIRKNHESDKPVIDAENDENAAMKFEDGLFVKQVIEKVKEDVTHVLCTKEEEKQPVEQQPKALKNRGCHNEEAWTVNNGYKRHYQTSKNQLT
ncbi:unnamed protein product [Mytilus edulis]|uniref:Uncharacterized protein n=1 Tax=Mytilus edulis TaxID=6550 RepID=A0A8S3SW29_MYTED|nr:unnamed protein product [Mytilus edulis]